MIKLKEEANGILENKMGKNLNVKKNIVGGFSNILNESGRNYSVSLSNFCDY
jgi:hypothetical protein